MNRWTRTAFAGVALVAAVASAQVAAVRSAPKDVRPAIISVSATPPVIEVDGKPDRFSPGARIRDLDERLVLTGSLAGRSVYSVYRRDAAGLVHEVWLLNEEEYRKLGGADPSSADGYRRFAELLDLVWASRWLLLK
jgi:hypothetical protein